MVIESSVQELPRQEGGQFTMLGACGSPFVHNVHVICAFLQEPWGVEPGLQMIQKTLSAGERCIIFYTWIQ